MKKALSLLLAVVFVLTCFSLSTSAAKKKYEKIAFQESIIMLKDKTDFIGVKCVDKNTKLVFSSDDSSVASVSADGKISAKKCGIATIRGEAVKNGVMVVLKLKVKVIISRNYLYKSFGKAIPKSSVTSKKPIFVVSKQLAKGDTSRISLRSTKKGDTVKYASSNASIARIDGNGKITAVSAGNATVKATVKRAGKSFVFKERVKVVESDQNKTITTQARNSYYSTSAFVGSSIGVGQKYYFDRQGSGYLGNPLMLVRGCYSFNNDKRLNTNYVPLYKGVAMRVKDSIKKSGVDKVFINMGTNDFYSSANSTYNAYVEYLEGIRKENPTVEIFIESTTGVHARGQKRVLNSANVRALNSMIKDYCSKHKDMYYIDITTRMLDANGHLSSACCSDNYVHLTNKAYAMWMEDVTAYTDKLMIKKQNVEDAVKTAEQSKSKSMIKRAKDKAAYLSDSTFKTNMLKRLNSIKATKA